MIKILQNTYRAWVAGLAEVTEKGIPLPADPKKYPRYVKFVNGWGHAVVSCYYTSGAPRYKGTYVNGKTQNEVGFYETGEQAWSKIYLRGEVIEQNFKKDGREIYYSRRAQGA